MALGSLPALGQPTGLQALTLEVRYWLVGFGMTFRDNCACAHKVCAVAVCCPSCALVQLGHAQLLEHCTCMLSGTAVLGV